MDLSIHSTILQAARTHQTLVIEYLPKDSFTHEQREIEPYSFRPQGTTDRLMAWDTDKQGVRSFLTENIRSACITERTFIPKYPIDL